VTRFSTVVRRAREGAAAVLCAARRALKREEGASLVEYALLVALIALICIIAVATLGTTVNNVFNNIVQGFTSNKVGG
jgi:pilus assembly protein Flp/PilA